MTTAATATGKSTILINPSVKDSNGAKWYYDTATTAAGLISVAS